MWVQVVHSAPARRAHPKPDRASRVAGDEGLYAAELWLIGVGPYSVRVIVNGKRGTGETFDTGAGLGDSTLPLGGGVACAERSRPDARRWGAIHIVGAAVREGVLKLARSPTRSAKARQTSNGCHCSGLVGICWARVAGGNEEAACIAAVAPATADERL